MYNVNLTNSRYFEIKIGDKVLNLEPCKLKTLQKFQQIGTNEGTNEDLIYLVSLVLNKNKTNYKVPDEIIEELTIDQINELLLSYFSWIAKEKNSNPN